MMTLDNRVRRPAWREPMVWLVALIPLAAVVGTLWMVFVASDAPGTDDAVADPVRRTAQVQVADLGPDARAQALRLSAVVRSSRLRGKAGRDNETHDEHETAAGGPDGVHRDSRGELGVYGNPSTRRGGGSGAPSGLSRVKQYYPAACSPLICRPRRRSGR